MKPTRQRVSPNVAQLLNPDGLMKLSATDVQRITQEACKGLGMYRRRLRAHEMLPEDEIDLAQILEWVEDVIVTINTPTQTHD